MPHTVPWKEPLATLVTAMPRATNVPFGSITRSCGSVGLEGVDVGVDVAVPGIDVIVTEHGAVAVLDDASVAVTFAVYVPVDG